METAGEGGPWGMAVLAAYMVRKDAGEKLGDYLANKVFHGEKGTVMDPDPADVAGFDAYIEEYKGADPAEYDHRPNAAETRADRNCARGSAGTAGPRGPARPRPGLSQPALRRTEAARGHRARPVHEARRDALR